MPNNHSELEQVGLRAVHFLTDNPDYLGRFLDQSGLSIDELRENIASQELQTGILDFLFSDESLLIVFCSSQDIDPAHLQKLYARLTYGGESF